MIPKLLAWWLLGWYLVGALIMAPFVLAVSAFIWLLEVADKPR